MKLVILGILSIIILFVPLAYAHDPDFDVKTPKDILKFCEFYYEEYELLGLNNLIEQHPNFPNLRACSILYEHLAWKSTHVARDKVLISIIEKYLGDSEFLKERHIREYNKMPEWVKIDTRLWVNGEISDSKFAYSIRSMLNANFLAPLNLSEKTEQCIENICLKEGDYAKYHYANKYGENISEKYTVKSITDKSIVIKSQIISQKEKTEKEFLLNEQKDINLNKACCENHRFIFPTPIKINQVLEGGFKVIGDTNYFIANTTRPSVIAMNQENMTTIIIDKETGLMLSSNHNENNIVIFWEKTELRETNLFGKTSAIHLENMSIPKWWKTTTMWYSEGHISEREYLIALENLIAREIIRV